MPAQQLIESPPHWLVIWPFGVKSSGFGTTPEMHGTWIMFAGTPDAHLMINQVRWRG